MPERRRRQQQHSNEEMSFSRWFTYSVAVIVIICGYLQSTETSSIPIVPEYVAPSPTFGNPSCPTDRRYLPPCEYDDEQKAYNQYYAGTPVSYNVEYYGMAIEATATFYSSAPFRVNMAFYLYPLIEQWRTGCSSEMRNSYDVRLTKDVIAIDNKIMFIICIENNEEDLLKDYIYHSEAWLLYRPVEGYYYYIPEIPSHITFLDSLEESDSLDIHKYLIRESIGKGIAVRCGFVDLSNKST